MDLRELNTKRLALEHTVPDGRRAPRDARLEPIVRAHDLPLQALGMDRHDKPVQRAQQVLVLGNVTVVLVFG